MQGIGQLALAQVDRATGSSTPSASLAHVEKPAIQMPTTKAECDALRHWATTTPIDRPTPASLDQIERHLEFLAATLPTKATDDESGKSRFAVYLSMLQGHSQEAFAHMSRTVCATLNWFPTPKQCLDELATYQRPVADQTRALAFCARFTTALFERWMQDLHDDRDVDEDVPEQWKRVATNQFLMRQLDDGRFVIRARYQGPLLPLPTVTLDVRKGGND